MVTQTEERQTHGYTDKRETDTWLHRQKRDNSMVTQTEVTETLHTVQL